MANFVLVPGAFHNGWCFYPVREILEQRGHRVMTPDLPGMGGSEAELRNASLAQWGAYIAGLCRGMRGDETEEIVLAGHSRGGLVISLAAEFDPLAIDKLIYITALMSPACKTARHTIATKLFENEAAADAVSLIQNGAGIIIDPNAARELYGQLSPSSLVEAAARRLTVEPASTFSATVEVTGERWGTVPRSFIKCLQDRTILPAVQDMMIAASPDTHVTSLDADHYPFLSATEGLADTLEAIALDCP